MPVFARVLAIVGVPSTLRIIQIFKGRTATENWLQVRLSLGGLRKKGTGTTGGKSLEVKSPAADASRREIRTRNTSARVGVKNEVKISISNTSHVASNSEHTI